MTKTVIVLIVLQLLFIVCGKKAKEGTVVYKNEPIEIAEHEIISNDEYAVYSVIMIHYYRDRPLPKLFAIKQQTTVYTELMDKRITELVERRLFEVDANLLNNFREKNLITYKLEKKFHIPESLVLITDDELEYHQQPEDWSKFHEKYPNSGGFIALSRVGFNKNHTESLVYFQVVWEFLAGRCILYTLMNEKGKWKVKRSCDVLTY